MFKVTNWVMKTAPIGVCALIGSTVAQMGLSALKPLSLFILLCYVSFAIFVIFVLGVVARIFGFRITSLFRVVKEEVALTFSTASSETVLPQLMNKMERFGVSRSIVSFVIPTSYSFNLDDAAIYGSLTALFLAQAYNINLTITQQISLVLVLMITSKGTAEVSGAVFVVLIATLSTIGVPTAGLALVAGVDRIIDMGRASVNVFGNSLASVVIAKSEHELDEEKSRQYLDKLARKNTIKNVSTAR
jgi:DAACS family dicarboxylate/amino acid:cation (Na+ or H+) symporter/proton glutamate symport protein